MSLSSLSTSCRCLIATSLVEGLLHFWEDDSTFMEWFCIETVDVATNSCSSPGFSSMCAWESKVTQCIWVNYPRKNWRSKLVSTMLCYKHQHLRVWELVLILMLDLDLYCKRVCVTQIWLVELLFEGVRTGCTHKNIFWLFYIRNASWGDLADKPL